MDIKGKVALITGGGTGLGREIAVQLAREGMHVTINYSRSEQDALDTVKELQELGVKAQAIQTDLSGPTAVADIKQMIEGVAESFGRLDLLINNAGVTKFVAFPNLDELEEADWDYILKVNTKVPFFTTRAAVPIMRQNGGGQVINTTSVAGTRAAGSSIAYAVSKAGMTHLTKCLAVALAPDIRVNAVAPGLLLTRWGQKFSPEQIKAMAQQAPLKKVTGIEDTAAAYVMLARNDSITGQIIHVDAGISLA